MQKENYTTKQLRQAAKIVSDILLKLKHFSVPEMPLNALEAKVAMMLKEAGATSASKGYKPSWSKIEYPSILCACLNDEVVHCPPIDKVLKEGDIITYDLGIKYNGVCGDAAITVPVGKIDNRKERLLRYSENALMKGINEVEAGVEISKIGKAIETYANENGYKVFKDFCGHHISTEMHEKPLIPNFESLQHNEKLEEGKVICIEPTLTPGRNKVITLADDWTTKSIDGQPCAMFEAMVLIKKGGYEILSHHL